MPGRTARPAHSYACLPANACDRLPILLWGCAAFFPFGFISLPSLSLPTASSSPTPPRVAPSPLGRIRARLGWALSMRATLITPYPPTRLRPTSERLPPHLHTYGLWLASPTRMLPQAVAAPIRGQCRRRKLCGAPCVASWRVLPFCTRTDSPTAPSPPTMWRWRAGALQYSLEASLRPPTKLTVGASDPPFAGSGPRLHTIHRASLSGLSPARARHKFPHSPTPTLPPPPPLQNVRVPASAPPMHSTRPNSLLPPPSPVLARPCCRWQRHVQAVMLPSPTHALRHHPAHLPARAHAPPPPLPRRPTSLRCPALRPLERRPS